MPVIQNSDQRLEETLNSLLQNALGTCNENCVDLISIRVTPTSPTNANTLDTGTDAFQNRLLQLTRRIMALKAQHQSHTDYNDYKVVINDIANIHAALDANADGMHVKEHDVAQYSITLEKEKPA